jgi:multidrug resistance efflux pump
LADQAFRIAQLKAEEALWKRRQENEIEVLKIDQQVRLAEIDRKIASTRRELAYRRSLFDSLTLIDPVESRYNPFTEKLASYQEEKREIAASYAAKIEGLTKELTLGVNPFNEEIRRYEAAQEFEEAQSHIPITVTAPTEGLIGNISCKEEEHIPAYSTLLTIYEPHSSVIKGYVHEDLTLEVTIGQSYMVSSLKNEQIRFSGKVIGLGSRIVEIPARLRKVEAVKAYGREVLIEIPPDNSFLQKEKVSIIHCSACDNKL